MRFIKAKLPQSPGFNPEEEGFMPIKEPAEKQAAVIINILAIALFAICLFICLELLNSHKIMKEEFDPREMLGYLLAAIIISLVIVFPHELIHAVCFPDKMASDKIVIGSYLKIGAFYAYYDGEISRERFLLVFIMPFLVFSAIPLILLLAGVKSFLLALLFIIHTPSCAGDLIGAFLILTRVPAEAIVRNKGWKTYYKAKNQSLFNI